MSHQTENKFGEGLSLMALGKSIWKVDPSEFETAIKTISQGLDILERLKLQACSFQGYLYLGDIYTTLNFKEEAHENLLKAKTMSEKMGIDCSLGAVGAA